MRIYTIKVYKLRGLIEFFKVLVALFLIFSLSFFACEIYVSSDEYVDAMQLASEKKIVILDAGHGGEDPGVVGVSGVYEKDLNLSFVLEIGSLLERAGYAVIYTRLEDRLLYKEEENIKGIRKISDLKNRTEIANQYTDAIFVSIHMNSYSDAKYSGTQVYYGKNNGLGRELAESIRSSVKERIQPNNERKTKPGEGMYILEHALPPSVIVECGFLTNREECEKLSEKEYQKSLCLAIVYGIIDYTEKNS